MAALRECMQFAARLSEADADDLISRVDGYIASGIEPAQAQRAATQDMLAEMERERGEVVALAEEQNGAMQNGNAPGRGGVAESTTGKPVIVSVFHGTAGPEFEEFRPRTARSVWFAVDQRYAQKYADSRQGVNRRVISATVSLQNPLVIDMKGRADPDTSKAKGALRYANTIEDIAGVAQQWGHDGVVFKNRKATDEGFASDEVAVFDPSSINRSDTTDGAEPGASSVSFSQPEPQAGPGFYSALRRLFSDAKTNASPAEYWTNLIKSGISKGTIKADEVTWSGISGWLEQQQGKVRKEAVLGWIDDNGVKVGETVLGEMSEDQQRARWEAVERPRLEALSEDDLRDEAQNFDPRASRNEMIADALDGAWSYYRGNTSDTGMELGAKYGQYTLPGGQNYREILLTLPAPSTAELDARIVKASTQAELDAAVAARRAVSVYKSGHWDQPNVIAHIRVNDRTDADGKRVLFVEEIQSDWGQAGKKKGFRDNSVLKREHLELRPQPGNKTNFIAVHDKRTGEMLSSYHATEAEANEAADEMVRVQQKRGGPIPAAPFVDKTDKWVALAIKRVIKMAVDGGYERVAFVTGEQAAERFSLDKHLSEIRYEPAGDGLYEISAIDLNGVEVIEEDEITIERVEELVGKEMAQKIAAGEGEKMNPPGSKGGGYRDWRSLSGISLKVEAKGMRAFYNTIVPSVTKDVLRKLGGKMGDVVFDMDGPQQAEKFGADPDDLSATATQPGFDITPAMAAKLADEGMPLFSQPSLAQPNQPWTGPGLSMLDDFRYNVQHKHIDLQRVVEAIKGSGATLNDRADGQLRETLYTGRVSARISRFEEGDLLPLLNEMRLAKVDLKQLGEYLHARHAAERNAEMRARNLNRQGNNDALSGMSDADAAAILAAAPPVMATLAARVDAMIAGTRNLMEISGIESSDTVDALRQSYRHYVPLHREETDSDHSAHPIGQGFSVKGSVPKRALGSETPVAHADILSHIISEREQVIIRAEKNLVAMAVYAMAQQNPNPDFWTTDTPPLKGYIDERVNIYVPGHGMMPNPNHGQVVYRADPNYKNQPNVLVVKVNGQDRSVTFNTDDPRAARMAEALKNLDVDNLGPVTRNAAKVTRFLASVNTQYNPVFSVKNFIRDLSAGLINLSSTEIAGQQAAVAAGIGPAMRAIYRTERGKTAANQQWASLYDEFRLRGAKTGYREMFLNEAERTKDLVKKAERLAGKMAPLQQTLDLLSDANDAIENAIRLSAYKVALDKGMSKDQAASLAKNLTVNFNRKGSKTSEVNAWYMFFNAAVQGSARLAETLKGPAAAKIIAGGLSLGVLQALAMLSMDDDEREAVPEFLKRTSIVIPWALFGIKGGKYTAVPLPLGLHAIPNTSRSLTELVLRRHAGDKVDIPSHIAGTFGAALDALSPVSGATVMQQIAPSVLDPVVQLSTNESWTGAPVYRGREPGTEGMPGYLMGRDSTSPVYKLLAKVIHLAANDLNPDVRNMDRAKIFSGTISPQPEAIRLIPETIFGGVWRETEKLLDTALGLTKDVPLDPARIPLLSAFYGDAGADMAAQGAFYRNLEKIEARATEKRNAKKDGRDAADSAWDEIGRLRAEVVRKQINRLIADRRDMAVEGGKEAEIRAIEREMGATMREFNAEAREALRSAK